VPVSACSVINRRVSAVAVVSMTDLFDIDRACCRGTDHSLPSPTSNPLLKLQQITACDVYVGGKVRVSEFMIFLDLQHCGSK